ncbi:hypothetical protein NDU88_005909 [Pleurodeles waltl]|uniref:Uncharacterized protein n=1 Tax=Pleurodeles waltl TaxID=8319 RepID=A0AAV7MEA9_PLEWA|nr:hypothetical protein NDU88_005909 [Pleurodeles waltl]
MQRRFDPKNSPVVLQTWKLLPDKRFTSSWNLLMLGDEWGRDASNHQNNMASRQHGLRRQVVKPDTGTPTQAQTREEQILTLAAKANIQEQEDTQATE